MFEYLEEVKDDYDKYREEKTKLMIEKFNVLEKLRIDYENIRSKHYTDYINEDKRIHKEFNDREVILEEENEIMIFMRDQYIKKIYKNSVFDVEMIGSSFAKIMSYFEGKNFIFDEKIIPIDVVYYSKYSSEILRYAEVDFLLDYISENGICPVQKHPIEYDDSLVSLFDGEAYVLYDTKNINNTSGKLRFYDESGERKRNYADYLYDYIDELIKYRLENTDELTKKKCEELADLYISKAKYNKPKTLVKK